MRDFGFCSCKVSFKNWLIKIPNFVELFYRSREIKIINKRDLTTFYFLRRFLDPSDGRITRLTSYVPRWERNHRLCRETPTVVFFSRCLIILNLLFRFPPTSLVCCLTTPRLSLLSHLGISWLVVIWWNFTSSPYTTKEFLFLIRGV